MADDKENPESGPAGRLDPGAGAELYAAAAADGDIDLSGLEARLEDEETLPPPAAALPESPHPSSDASLPEPPSVSAPLPADDLSEDDLPEDDLAGAAASQAAQQRAAVREARAFYLPYLEAVSGFFKALFLWFWKQFKAIPPMDDLFDQALFALGMQRKPQSMLRRASHLLMQGRLTEAVKWYRDILILRPLSVVAYDGLGQAYFRLGLVEEANREFAIAENLERLLQNRDDLEAAAALAQAFLDRRQAKVSVSLIEPVLISHFYSPDNSELLKTMGRVYQELRSNRKLYQVYAAGLAQHPEDYEYYILKGGAEQKMGNNAEGDRLIRWGRLLKRLKDDPQDANSKMTMGEICFKENKPEEGLRFLREAAALTPDNAALRMTMGEMCFKASRTEEGLAFLREAAELTPDNVGLRWRLYNLYMKQGNIPEALRYFLEITALDPENDDLQYRLAEFYRKHRRREEALPIYESLAGKHPRDPKPHALWGELSAEMGKMEESQRLKELAKLLTYGLKANPDHNETVAFMKYLFSIGQHGEARKWLERGLAKWPYHGELVMQKVKILYNEFQYKDAAALLKRLISYRPDVAEPHIWIAMCHQRLGDNMAALAEAQLSTRLAPKSYAAHKVLGDILKEQKKISQANAAYEVAEMMRLQKH